jgi:Mg2+/Co2+ transporter CorB
MKSDHALSQFSARLVDFLGTLYGVLKAAIASLLSPALRPLSLIGERPAMSAAEERRGQAALLNRDAGTKDQSGVLGGLLDLFELEVSDLMVHRTKMRTIDADLPRRDLVGEVLASPFSRLPLWRGKPENIVGIVHTKDVLRTLHVAGGDPEKLNVEDIALEPWFVPDTTSVFDQLKAFLARNAHLALVVDEYGEVMGLVTLQDILGEMSGDIKDQQDVAVEGVRPQPDGSVNVDGSVPVRDLNRAMGWSLPDEGATTVAGLVIHEARTIPEPGQTFTFYGHRFQAVRRSRNRVTLLRVTPLQPRRETAEPS